MQERHIHNGIHKAFKLLNSLAIIATTYFSSVILVRLVGGESPSFFGIRFDTKYALLVLGICTLLHIAALRYIVHYMKLAWQHLDTQERLELYFELTGANHLLTQGAERFRDNFHNSDGFLFVRVSQNDPPSLLHWFVFFAALLASIQFEVSTNLLWTSVLAMTLCMANWQISSSWLVALADLGQSSERSDYFDDFNRAGPRYFGVVSGPWHGMNNNIFVFSAVSVFDAFLRVLPASAIMFLLWIILESLYWMI